MSNELFLKTELKKARENNDLSLEKALLLELGAYYYEISEFEKSKRILSDLLAKNPKHEWANYYLGIISISESNNEKAISYLDKEIKIGKNVSAAKKLKEKLLIQTNLPLVTLGIILISSMMFFLTFPEISFDNLIKFSLSYDFINHYNLITSVFFHINLIHFMLNLSALFLIGFYLERHVGSLKFLTVFLISGVLGNLVQAYLSSGAFVLGASTGIFGLIGLLVMREPLLKIKIAGIFPVRIIVLFGGFFFVENLIKIFFLKNYLILGSSGHIAGFFIGIFLAGIMYRETIETFYNWLGISFGFFLILYSTRFARELLNSFNVYNSILLISLIVFGVLSILYSYYKLKIMKLEEIGE